MFDGGFSREAPSLNSSSHVSVQLLNAQFEIERKKIINEQKLDWVGLQKKSSNPVEKKSFVPPREDFSDDSSKKLQKTGFRKNETNHVTWREEDAIEIAVATLARFSEIRRHVSLE